MGRRISNERQRTESFARSLDALSPLKVLGRGYSITRRLDTGAVIRAAADVAAGESVETILASGRLISRVEAAASGSGPVMFTASGNAHVDKQ